MDPALKLIPLIGILIPVIAIVMGIGIGMLSIFLNYRKRKEMFTLYHQERMAAIEKGIELPPLPDAFFTDEGRPLRRSPHRPLLVGLILLFIGLVLFGAFYYQRDLDTAIFTLAPSAVGLAYLIYYFTVGRREALCLEAAEKAKATSTQAA